MKPIIKIAIKIAKYAFITIFGLFYGLLIQRCIGVECMLRFANNAHPIILAMITVVALFATATLISLDFTIKCEERQNDNGQY